MKLKEYNKTSSVMAGVVPGFANDTLSQPIEVYALVLVVGPAGLALENDVGVNGELFPTP